MPIVACEHEFAEKINIMMVMVVMIVMMVMIVMIVMIACEHELAAEMIVVMNKS